MRPDGIFTGPLQQQRGFFVPLAPDFGEQSEKRPRKPDFCSGWKTRRREGAAYDRFFGQHNALPAGRHARTGLPAGRGAGTTVARTCTVRATVPSWWPPESSPRVAPSWPGGHRAVPAGGFGRALQPGPAPGRADLTGRAESRVDACGPGRQASPPRRLATGPAAAAPGSGGAGPAVTARGPAPGPAGLPLRQGRAAGQALPVCSRGTSRPRDRLSGLAWLPFPAGGQPLASVPPAGPGAGGGRT